METIQTTHLVYCGAHGWWGKAGTYVTSFKDAKPFTREAAIRFCSSRFNGNTSHEVPAVPVAIADISAFVR